MLGAFLLISTNGRANKMSDVIIYNPDDTIVANRVTNYLQSVNTPDYEDNPHALINPDLSGVSGIDQKYWKVNTDSVIEMTSEEKTALNNFLAAKTIKEKKYQVQTYDSNYQLVTDTWYNTDNGGGSYSVKVEETTYAYSGNNIISKIVKIYHFDGTEASSETWQYLTDGTKQIMKKSGG
jgi:hypothetical protein